MSDERITVGTETSESRVLPAETDVLHSDGRTDDRIAAATAYHPNSDSIEPLFSSDECRGLRSRWESLQAAFVDEPKRSVEQADSLVNEAVTSLTRNFTNERQKLEQQWHRGEDVSTEDLRLAFRRYRSFFERLLTM